MANLCPGDTQSIWKPTGVNNSFADFSGRRPHGFKRPRLTCQVCGRRLRASVQVDHDGCHVIFTIPKGHKPRGWWRKPKKVSHA